MTYNDHKKPINEVSFIPSSNSLVAITCSDDNEAHLIRYNPETNEIIKTYTADQHEKSVSSLAVHPIRSLFILGSQDGSFSYHDSFKAIVFNLILIIYIFRAHSFQKLTSLK